jgi:hypothetical protein
MIPQAVCVSVCGNFGLAGTSNGIVDMWNLQSGAKRKSFAVGPSPTAITRRSKGKKTEQRVISGIATDSLNRTVIASTLDGTINVSWYMCQELPLSHCKSSSSISIRQNWNTPCNFRRMLCPYSFSATAVFWLCYAMIWLLGSWTLKHTKSSVS